MEKNIEVWYPPGWCGFKFWGTWHTHHTLPLGTSCPLSYTTVLQQATAHHIIPAPSGGEIPLPMFFPLWSSLLGQETTEGIALCMTRGGRWKNLMHEACHSLFSLSLFSLSSLSLSLFSLSSLSLSISLSVSLIIVKSLPGISVFFHWGWFILRTWQFVVSVVCMFSYGEEKNMGCGSGNSSSTSHKTRKAPFRLQTHGLSCVKCNSWNDTTYLLQRTTCIYLRVIPYLGPGPGRYLGRDRFQGPRLLRLELLGHLP